VIAESLEERVLAYIEFRIKPHEILTCTQMVEVWRDGTLAAGIYPHEDGLRIVSKYMAEVEQQTGYPPSFVMFLTPMGDEPHQNKGQGS